MCLHNVFRMYSEKFIFIEEGDDVEQKILLACSCYKGVRGDHCIHKLATEMFLGERRKPSEEKKLTSRRKKGRVPKNSKNSKFWMEWNINEIDNEINHVEYVNLNFI